MFLLLIFFLLSNSDTNTLIDSLKERLGKENIEFVNNMKKVFEEDAKGFVGKDIRDYKWSAFTLKLMKEWNLNDIDAEQIDQNVLKEKASQDFILNKYI